VRAVNLLPRDEQRERLQSARLPLFLAAGGVVAVTAAAMFVASSAAGSASQQRADLEALRAATASLPKAEDPAVTQGMLLQERSDRVAALSAALSSRVAFDRLLREISFVLPEDAWLTQLEASAPVSVAPVTGGPAPPPQASATPEGVTIQGATFSHDSVARVLSRLSVVPSLENVRLTATARVEPHAEGQGDDAAATAPRRGKPFVTFVISASLRTGASQ
jgi:Tfp pilus assembly protein PilN